MAVYFLQDVVQHSTFIKQWTICFLLVSGLLAKHLLIVNLQLVHRTVLLKYMITFRNSSYISIGFPTLTDHSKLLKYRRQQRQ